MRRQAVIQDRPETFTLNRNHWLAGKLSFAGLGQVTGSNLYRDSSHYHADGTFTGTMTATYPHVYDPYMRRMVTVFDGTSDYINCGFRPQTSPTDALSMSCWIKCSTGIYHTIGRWSDTDGTHQQYALVMNGGLPYFIFSNTSNATVILTPVKTIGDNAWHHVFMSWSQTACNTPKLYIDGALDKTGDAVTTALYTTSAGTPLTIGGLGAEESTYWFTGSLADVMIWNRYFTAEAAAVLSNRRDLMYSGLLQSPRRRFHQVQIVAPPVSVTINQADGQADPSTGTAIVFTAIFSEAVSDFYTADVTIGGTANPATCAVELAGDMTGTTYTITVGGMTNSGTVTASIAAGVAHGTISGIANAASTSTDNTVTYAPAPTVTINQAAGQADPTTGTTINFTVVFSEAVTGFATGDVTLSGTAGATTATVTGNQGNTTFAVAVTGMTASGTVIVSIAAGVATSASYGVANAASTSTDNSVTYSVGVSTTLELYYTAGSAVNFNDSANAFDSNHAGSTFAQTVKTETTANITGQTLQSVDGYSGEISKVRIGAKIDDASDGSQFHLQMKPNGTGGTNGSTTTTPSSSTMVWFDCTTASGAPGTWQWSDMAALDAALFLTQTGEGDFTVNVDFLAVEVTYLAVGEATSRRRRLICSGE